MNQDKIDIVDVLRYSVDISLNGLRQIMTRMTKEVNDAHKLFNQFMLIFKNSNLPYHKTKEFRRAMYYRRYKRNAYRSKKR